MRVYEIREGGETNVSVVYVEPEGIVIVADFHTFLPPYEGINEEDLNLFFSSIWRVFGYCISKYLPTVKVNFYTQLQDTDSLIVKFPIEALLDFFKEKISRSEFLK
ncbi:MAG: hypothetical protein ACK4R7_02125 [Fervidobacterium sp.]